MHLRLEPPRHPYDVASIIYQALAVGVGDNTLAGNSALLVSKLYRLKLEQLIEARSATTCVARCGQCGRLYSAAARSNLVCPRARLYVDFNGAIIARHTPMRRFELQRHLGQAMLVETLETRVESAWF